MNDKVESITVTELRRWQNEQRSFAILDVREPWELEICALPDAISIPLRLLPERARELPTDIPLVVVCHHGMRSQQAVNWLKANGLDTAINLSGGIDSWARIVDRTMGVY